MATFKNSLQALREERGAIFVLTAILLPVILGFMGFGYDVGNLYMHKARLQNAADAASLAGARAFVDEAASQRKTLRTQYMNNNNVTSIPTDVSAEINETVKTEAKTAAKTAAVANVAKNMVNLHNNDYQSKYYLITGRITESGKNYEQQYFKANLEETVPLYFIPILLDLKEQKVAAEAISTIINKGTGKASNKKEKFGPDSLFMTKHGFANLGDTFYNDGAGNTDTKAPTWTDDYFEGNLRYTEDDFVADFGNSTKVNNYAGGVPFEGVFNKKATELMTKLKKLMNGYNEADYNAFIDELKTHPDFYSVENNAFTEKGNVLFQKTQELLPNSGVQGNFWGVYNAFYDELVSNKNYFRTFQKLENYNIDKFGESIKSLFKTKLQQESNQTEEEINNKLTAALATWQTQENDWQAKHSKWLEDKAKAEEDAAQEVARLEQEAQQSGNSGNNPLTLQDAANILRPYHEMFVAYANNGGNIWDEEIKTQVWNQYVADNKPFGIKDYEINNYLGGNWQEPDSGWTWKNLPNDKWPWTAIRADYEAVLGYSLTADSSEPSIPTVEQLMQEWLQNNPEPLEPQKPTRESVIVGSNGDEYYAQYHGSENNWTASAISSQQNSKEHSYFYYPAPNNFTLTIDAAGFYTDENVTAEDPFYLFIGDNFQGDAINIILDADVNRPLIFCYMGTKNIKIHIELQGHTFQGIIYTPHAHGSEVFMNTNNGSGTRGTFKGTWMSDTITLKQNSSYYEYAEFYLDSSLKSAMPNFTGEIQEGDDEYGDDEDLADKNPIKVIKLVKSVTDPIEVEEIN